LSHAEGACLGQPLQRLILAAASRGAPIDRKSRVEVRKRCQDRLKRRLSIFMPEPQKMTRADPRGDCARLIEKKARNPSRFELEAVSPDGSGCEIYIHFLDRLN